MVVRDDWGRQLGSRTEESGGGVAGRCTLPGVAVGEGHGPAGEWDHLGAVGEVENVERGALQLSESMRASALWGMVDFYLCEP